MEIVAVIAVFAVDDFVAESALEDVVAVDAILTAVEVAAVHAVFVFYCVCKEIAVFAFIDVVAKIRVCMDELNHSDSWSFELKCFVVFKETHIILVL